MKQTYEKLFGCDDTYAEILEKSGIDEKPSKADIAFAESIVSGVQANIDAIDELIASASVGWSIDRMPRVDLSIIRNAVYAICFDDAVPHAVAANEAVELAKVYCDEKSPKFINGLLGQIIRSRGNAED